MKKRVADRAAAGQDNDSVTIKLRIPRGLTKERLQIAARLDGFKSISAWVRHILVQDVEAVEDSHCIART